MTYREGTVSVAKHTYEVNGTYKANGKNNLFSNLYVANSASAAEKEAKRQFESNSSYYNVPRGTKLSVTNSREISESEIKRSVR